jgi:hypothetical protein
MENPAGNKSLGMLVTSSNFHSFPLFSVSAATPLFKRFGGHPWKSMEEALANQGFESPRLQFLNSGPKLTLNLILPKSQT